MLQVDIREVLRGPVRTEGRLGPEDAAFDGLDLGLNGPVTVQGQLQATGDGEYLWRGHVHGDANHPQASSTSTCFLPR